MNELGIDARFGDRARTGYEHGVAQRLRLDHRRKAVGRHRPNDRGRSLGVALLLRMRRYHGRCPYCCKCNAKHREGVPFFGHTPKVAFAPTNRNGPDPDPGTPPLAALLWLGMLQPTKKLVNTNKHILFLLPVFVLRGPGGVLTKVLVDGYESWVCEASWNGFTSIFGLGTTYSSTPNAIQPAARFRVRVRRKAKCSAASLELLLSCS